MKTRGNTHGSQGAGQQYQLLNRLQFYKHIFTVEKALAPLGMQQAPVASWCKQTLQVLLHASLTSHPSHSVCCRHMKALELLRMCLILVSLQDNVAMVNNCLPLSHYKAVISQQQATAKHSCLRS
jgi:hypothetical protein